MGALIKSTEAAKRKEERARKSRVEGGGGGRHAEKQIFPKARPLLTNHVHFMLYHMFGLHLVIIKD